MTSTHVQAFNRALADARDSAKRARTDVQNLSRMRREINRIGKTIALNMSEADTMHLYLIGTTPHFSVTMRNLESFKCLALEGMLWTMNEIGKATHTRDWPDYLNREYNFEVNGAKVCINAYVKSDSPTCRKVVVGTETITQPKYKIECD